MLVQSRTTSERWFRQVDHAALCGALADRWRTPGGAPLSDAVRAAARHHDDGWSEVDDEAWSGGRVIDFQRATRDERLRIWRRCITRAAERLPGAGVLTSLHFASFVRSEHPADEAFVDEQRRWRMALSAEHGLDLDALRAAYPAVAALDKLSLFACLAAPGARPDAVPGWLTPDVDLGHGTLRVAWNGGDELALRPPAASPPNPTNRDAPAVLPLTGTVRVTIPWVERSSSGLHGGRWHLRVVAEASPT